MNGSTLTFWHGRECNFCSILHHLTVLVLGVMQLKDFASEVALLKDCKNKHVVQFYGACLQSGNVMMVTEYMELGNLYDSIKSYHSTKLNWNKR